MDASLSNAGSSDSVGPMSDNVALVQQSNLCNATVMAPSIGLRFSGINATMEALLPVMRESIPIACCGANLSQKMPRVSLWQWLRSSRRKHWRIWHARRNNDMLVGIILRYVLRQKLILLFTSAGQRKHTWLTRFCYHRMDAVIATTEKAASFLERSATISHHGVDTSIYHPTEDQPAMRQSLGIEDRPTLGVFGRIRAQKGTGDLVEALLSSLGHYPEWQVVLIGAVTEQHIPYKDDLEKQLRDAGLADRVHFQGFLKDFAELPKWYQAVDVVGCVSRNEGFGVTCLEGMASGVPVVATRAGAWEEIITEGQDGWIADPNDPNDLARALNLVFASSPESLKQMGQAARQTVLDRFQIQHEVKRIASVYDRLFATYDETADSQAQLSNS